MKEEHMAKQKRGLAAADERTRQRVARAGGKASGRSRRNESNQNNQ
jgi:hypothetical protein